MVNRSRKGSRARLVGIGIVLVVVVSGLTVRLLDHRLDSPDRPDTARSGPICEIAPADGEAAVTAAIAGCPDGTTVLFPRDRVYHQSSTIKVERRINLTIDGNGSSFISAAPNDGQLNPNWMVVEASDVTLHGMSVEGNFKMSGPRSLERMQQVLPSGNHFNAGISVYGGKGVTIRDITIRDTFGDGVLAAPSGILPGGAGATSGIPRDVRFQRLTITRTARQGVAVTGGIGIWLEDSHLVDSWYWGVDLEIDASSQPLKDVHILRNTFDGTFFGAIVLPWPGDGHSVDAIEIRGNRTLRPPDGCGAQISINAYPGQSVAVGNIVTEENELLTWSRGIVYRKVTTGAIRNNHVERLSGRPCGDPEQAAAVVSESPAVLLAKNVGVNY